MLCIIIFMFLLLFFVEDLTEGWATIEANTFNTKIKKENKKKKQTSNRKAELPKKLPSRRVDHSDGFLHKFHYMCWCRSFKNATTSST